MVLLLGLLERLCTPLPPLDQVGPIGPWGKAQHGNTPQWPQERLLCTASLFLKGLKRLLEEMLT